LKADTLRPHSCQLWYTRAKADPLDHDHLGRRPPTAYTFRYVLALLVLVTVTNQIYLSTAGERSRVKKTKGLPL